MRQRIHASQRDVFVSDVEPLVAWGTGELGTTAVPASGRAVISDLRTPFPYDLAVGERVGERRHGLAGQMPSPGWFVAAIGAIGVVQSIGAW